MKNKVLALVAMSLLSGIAFAQTVTGHPLVSQFSTWRVYGQQNLAVGANANVSIASCAQTGGGLSFYAVSASTPVKIVDPGNPAIDETITPTAVVAGGNCTATLTTANAHPTPWYLISGTGGLQEAINAGKASSTLNIVDLGPSFHQAGFGAQTWSTAAGSTNIAIADSTVSPSAVFKWNGTNYIAAFSPNGLTATIAAGAAAGTAPTVSNNAGGSGNIITANVTTGTSPTTGTLFTETVTATAGNLNCSIPQSVGANNFPVTISYSPASTTVATFTVAVAPPASTAYVFTIACQ